MPRIGIIGAQGKFLVEAMKRNVIIAGSNVVIDSRDEKGTFLSINTTPNDTVEIVEFSDIVIVGITGSDDLVYGPYAPDGGVSGTVAQLSIVLGAFTYPTAFSASLTIDGTPITFGGMGTSVAVDLPAHTQVDAIADPGQPFTSVSDIIFTLHEEGNPLVDLGSFDIILYGFPS